MSSEHELLLDLIWAGCSVHSESVFQTHQGLSGSMLNALSRQGTGCCPVGWDDGSILMINVDLSQQWAFLDMVSAKTPCAIGLFNLNYHIV